RPARPCPRRSAARRDRPGPRFVRAAAAPARSGGPRRLGELPDVVIGAGTVYTPAQVKLAAEAGARFLVSPGATDQLLDAMDDSGLPFLAGCATPSDMLRLLERGVTEAKLFPA